MLRSESLFKVRKKYCIWVGEKMCLHLGHFLAFLPARSDESSGEFPSPGPNLMPVTRHRTILKRFIFQSADG